LDLINKAYIYINLVVNQAIETVNNYPVIGGS